MLRANLMAVSFIEPELWAIEVYIAGIGILDVFGSCDLYLDPMTFIYETYQYCLQIYRMCKLDFLSQGFRKLSSERQTYTYRVD